MKITVKILSIALAILMMCAFPISAVAAFNDTANSPYDDAISSLASLNLVKGTGGNMFSPDANVTRQEMTLFIARLKSGLTIDDSSNAVNTTNFTDLVDPVYNHGISYCYENGIVIGKGGTIFDPTGNVTVQEAITMAVRTLGYNNLDYPNGYISRASDFGLLDNLDNLDYEAPMLRGAVAQLIYNTLYCESNKSGQTFYDAFFAPAQKLGYFEISTLEELKQNYECKDITDAAGTTKYRVKATLFGYEGYIYYSFNSGNGCKISFQFSIQGHFENDPNRPSVMKLVNSTADLSAAEAKTLIESVNQKVSDYLSLPIAEATASSMKDNAPSDLYEAAAKNYTNIKYVYNREAENPWSLFVRTGSRTGMLVGELTRWVPVK